MPSGVQMPPGQLPEVVEWGLAAQTQFTVSPALIMIVLGEKMCAAPGAMTT